MVNKNKIIRLEIVDNGMNGEGIGKYNGITVFVPSTLKGEIVDAKVVQEKKNFWFAKVIKIIQPSTSRISPPCPVFFKCGGCQLQHVVYSSQLKIKENHLLTNLHKQLDRNIKINEIVASSNQFNYRNKASLPIGLKNGRIFVGVYESGTHNIIEISDCILFDKWLKKVVDSFLKYANNSKISVYDEFSHTGLLRHLVVRKISNNLNITVVINGTTLPNYQLLINELNQALDENWSLFISKNTAKTNVIMSDNIKLLHGFKTFNTNMLGLEISVNPLSFFQVNNEISTIIYKKIIDVCKGNNNLVIDAYSGAGLLTNLIARNTKFAYGIEIVPEAVSDANALSANNNVSNINNICGDSSIELPKILKSLSKEDLNNTTVILDPPRKGCEKKLLEELILYSPKSIIYLSCNPSSLARDMSIIMKNSNYGIEFIQPYDMFPQTFHVETLVKMNKI